jgi:branched-chain amino acid transport system substrate-binding protein
MSVVCVVSESGALCLPEFPLGRLTDLNGLGYGDEPAPAVHAGGDGTEGNKHEGDERTMSQHPKVGSISRRATLSSGGLAVAAGLTLGSNRARSAEPVVIGTAAALTGWGAADGMDFKQGAEMAVADLNALGGICGRPVIHVAEDAKEMGPQNNIAATRALIDRRQVHAICNGYLVGAGPEYDAIADANVIHINAETYETTAKIVRSNPERYYGIFSDPTEVWYGTGLLIYLKDLIDKGKFKPYNNKVALITSNNPYSILIAQVVRDNATKYGWEVSLYEEVVQPIAEWGPTLAKIRANPPGLIANTHFFPQDIAQFALQFAQNPTPSLVYMQYGPSIPEFIALAKDAANGIIWATVIGTLPGDFGLNFEDRYKKQYGAAAGFRNAGQTYDAVMVYGRAAAIAGGVEDPKKIARVLKHELIHRGVCGAWRFNTDDQCARPYPDFTDDPSLGMAHHFYQIQNKQQVMVAPRPYVTGEFKIPSWIK